MPHRPHPGRRPARWATAPAAALLLAAGAVLWPGPAAIACGLLAGALLAGWALAAVMARQWVTVTIHGSSMEPTYRNGDGVLVRRTDRVRAGQVVVLEAPTNGRHWSGPPVPTRSGAAGLAGRRWIIKRVAAAPGDPVPPAVRDSVPAADPRVPAGRLVLLGDNPAGSLDSRQVGYFPAARVLGVTAGRGTGARRPPRSSSFGHET